LHGIKDPSVAKKLTQIIRDNLPNGVPQPIKDSLTVKSLRKASITTLAHMAMSQFLILLGVQAIQLGLHRTATLIETVQQLDYEVDGFLLVWRHAEKMFILPEWSGLELRQHPMLLDS
jgi:hypothetical protein